MWPSFEKQSIANKNLKHSILNAQVLEDRTQKLKSRGMAAAFAVQCQNEGRNEKQHLTLISCQSKLAPLFFFKLNEYERFRIISNLIKITQQH